MEKIKAGVKGYLELLLFLLPVYTLVFFLQRWGVLEGLAAKAEPFMGFVGLPGEAALVIILGNFVNLYAALGAVAGLGLSSREVTILALMLLLSHNQILEGAVILRVRRGFLALAPLRFVVSVLAAHVLHPYL